MFVEEMDILSSLMNIRSLNDVYLTLRLPD